VEDVVSTLDDASELLLSLLAPSEDSLLLELEGWVALLDFRLSVMYQPEPLKITPTGWSTRLTGPPPQFRHSVSGSAVMDCIFSKRVWQFLHSYSYIGMSTSIYTLMLYFSIAKEIISVYLTRGNRALSTQALEAANSPPSGFP
jgi:hypothetical protein